jgi:8-oxo-dGTP pyrophosphatase MutT (NUDIX family)
MLRFHQTGNWAAGQVSISWIPERRRIEPQVEAAIERAWAGALARPGVHLFDGPMCRLESWDSQHDRLSLVLSRTSYKAFLGTNMTHPEFADSFGRDVMANPVGVSPALLTADRFLMLGRRNASVAYYPSRIHPFAGALEPDDTDLFDAVRRELHEELSLTASDIADIRCTGIVEDIRLRQPELIFAATTTKTRAQIDSQLDRTEHLATWSIPATAPAVADAVVQDREKLTPVAVASLLLWGRLQFGEEWFGKASSTL